MPIAAYCARLLQYNAACIDKLRCGVHANDLHDVKEREATFGTGYCTGQSFRVGHIDLVGDISDVMQTPSGGFYLHKVLN